MDQSNIPFPGCFASIISVKFASKSITVEIFIKKSLKITFFSIIVMQKPRNSMMKKFLLSLGLLTITILLCAANTDQYSVLVFGDLHHDARDLRVNDPGKNKEFKRNIEAWKNHIPGMLQTAAGIANKDCAFAVQCGDITQGDEGSYEFSAASFKRVLAEMEKYLQIPFYPVRGNHDVRGIGKRKASDDILPAYLKKKTQSFRQKIKARPVIKFTAKIFLSFLTAKAIP